jgi:hypothetical protein
MVYDEFQCMNREMKSIGTTKGARWRGLSDARMPNPDWSDRTASHSSIDLGTSTDQA